MIESPDPVELDAEAEADAAAAEAGDIGGREDALEDPERVPVERAGGGESEGFEQAEEALLSGNDPPTVNRANIVTYYFLTQFLLIVIVLATGVAGWDALARAIVLFPVMVLGAWGGGRLFHGLASERLYRNVALCILFATGMFGLLRSFFH